ncbi:MAG: hypothetical protein Q8911_00400 [Bacillota bacterium]|nr:hypothetical protein [Bacillota bacterium]
MAYEFYVTPTEYTIAESNGIHHKLVDQRVRQYGWDKERAITQPPKVENKTNKKWLKVAEKNGISYKTFLSRLKKGLSPEDASTLPIYYSDHKRRYPKEYTEKAKQLGIYRTFIWRMHNDWDIEKACSTPAMTKQEVGKIAKSKSKWRAEATSRKRRY